MTTTNKDREEACGFAEDIVHMVDYDWEVKGICAPINSIADKILERDARIRQEAKAEALREAAEMDHRAFVEKLYEVRAEPDKLNALIMRERSTLPPEPRTCEMPDCQKTGGRCEYVDDARCGYPEEPCYKMAHPRAPQSADVETVREALDSFAHAASCGYAMSLKRCNEIRDEALAALDRIAGKLG